MSAFQGQPVPPDIWDAWTLGGFIPYEITAAEMGFLAHHTSDRHGRIAVDAGCGIGDFCRRLRTLGYHVTGVDYSACSLEVARAKGHGPGLKYLDADLEDGVPCGLPLHGVHLVVARTLLPFLFNPAKWLHQVRDLWLAPGGQVYLVALIGREQPLQTGQMPPTAIEALCEGWQVERQDTGGAASIILRPYTR